MFVCFPGWISPVHRGTPAECKIVLLHLVQSAGCKTEIFQKTRKTYVAGRGTALQRRTDGKFSFLIGDLPFRSIFMHSIAMPIFQWSFSVGFGEVFEIHDAVLLRILLNLMLIQYRWISLQWFTWLPRIQESYKYPLMVKRLTCKLRTYWYIKESKHSSSWNG